MYDKNFLKNLSNNNYVNDFDVINHYKLCHLVFVIIIILTIIGNSMVVLAVLKNRNLQNTTNYFLMSLAIADMLVAILVMPFSLTYELIGYFPFGRVLCILWLCADIFLCTCSIWHMCIMSMDRFFTISFPLKYGRNKTRKLMLTKIIIVWLISMSISSPLFMIGYFDPSSLYIDSLKQCSLSHSQFKLHGSVFAFCIPFLIISSTYTCTIISLKKIIKKKEFRSSRQEKKFSIVSNMFYNSDKRSSIFGSIQNFENKRKLSNISPMPKIQSINDVKHEGFFNPCELKNPIIFNEYNKIKLDFESCSLSKHNKIKRSKSFDDLEDKIRFKTNSSSSDRLYKSCDLIKRDEAISKTSESIPSILILRKKSNHHLRPLDRVIHRIESEMDRLLSNYSKNDISAISQNPSSFLSICTPNDLKDSRTTDEFKIRKNSTVTFFSNSLYEKRSSIPDGKKRKFSKHKLMNQIGDVISNSGSRKKSVLYSADMILRSNSLFSGSHSMRCKMKQMKIYNKQNNEGKALKVLMIIFFMFVLFWSPFFIVNILSALCTSCKFVNNNYLIIAITWLGYGSSMINPIVYTMFNKSFRRAFINLLKCQTKKYNELKRQRNIIFRNFHYSSTRNSKLFV